MRKVKVEAFIQKGERGLRSFNQTKKWGRRDLILYARTVWIINNPSVPFNLRETRTYEI
jgi:hypothetical protein